MRLFLIPFFLEEAFNFFQAFSFCFRHQDVPKESTHQSKSCINPESSMESNTQINRREEFKDKKCHCLFNKTSFIIFTLYSRQSNFIFVTRLKLDTTAPQKFFILAGSISPRRRNGTHAKPTE